MDELLGIEKQVGEITGMIGLQFSFHNELVQVEDIVYEHFEEPVPVQPKQKVEGED